MNRSPKLREDLVIVEQTYRGEQTYIVKDPETHKYFRFKPLEVLVMQQFDGEHSSAEVSAALEEHGLPLKPVAVEAFARKLDKMGILEQTLAEKSVLQMERLRAERQRRVKGTHYKGSLLRMRWSAGDPDELFDRWLPRLKFFFTPAFLAVSVVLFVVYFAILVLRWPDIWAGMARLYDPSSYTLGMIVVFWGTAMVVIVIHELGHGITCKYFGGQVHEMGAMLIYFEPAFYCNVNDAWTFPKLSDRIWVTAAGSWIQMVVAAVAGMVWVVVQPDTLVSQIAFAAVLVGGATTVLANANPLIPLDGYYALSDYLEIPNLRFRALAYLEWMVKRHVLRLELPEPQADEREKKVFLIYGTLAFLYIALILTVFAALALGWVRGALGTLGVLAFLFLLWAMLRSAIRDWRRAAVTSVREHRAFWRSRKTGGITAALVVVLAAGLLVPWPIVVKGRFTAAGVSWSVLTAAEDAVVGRVYVIEGARVEAGTPLVRLRNLELEREALAVQRAADSLAVRVATARATADAGALRQLEVQQAETTARLAAMRARLERLTLRAPVAGVVVTPRVEEIGGRWFEAGETVVQLHRPDSLELRIALQRAGARLVEPGQQASIVSYSDVAAPVRATVTSVAATGDAEDGVMEARVRLANRGDGLRPGVTGEAKIVVRRSNVFGAILWAVRKRVRGDLFL